MRILGLFGRLCGPGVGAWTQLWPVYTVEVWTGFLICTLMGRTNIYVQYSTQYGEIPPAQHLIENSNHVSHQTLDQKNYSEC